MKATAALSLVFFLAAATPQPAAAQDAAQPEQVRTRPNPWLVGGGAGTLYVSYGTPLAISALYFALIFPLQAGLTDDDTPSATVMWLAVPIAGPVMTARSDFGRDNPGARTALYIDAGVQAAGLALLVSGFIFQEEHQTAARPATAGWRIGPGPAGSAGFSLGLTFE